jgi:hypothetical protein
LTLLAFGGRAQAAAEEAAKLNSAASLLLNPNTTVALLRARFGQTREANMDNTTLLIIIIIVVIILGAGWYGRGRWF